MQVYKCIILIGLLLTIMSCNLTIREADKTNPAKYNFKSKHSIDSVKCAILTECDDISIDIVNPIDILEIHGVTMRHDTLSVFGWAPYLVFPLDTFKTPDAIIKAYPFFNLKVEQSLDPVYPHLIDIYTYTYQNSIIKFTESEPDYYLDIMSGDIIDERIVLRNSIHVGFKKEDVFKLLNIQCDKLSDINTLEFICTLDGYWQYYTFANDTLRRIKIDSH